MFVGLSRDSDFVRLTYSDGRVIGSASPKRLSVKDIGTPLCTAC